MNGTRLGFALCGSYCTFDKALETMESLRAGGYEIFPIMSANAGFIDTRFGEAEGFRKRIREISGREIIDTINAAEPIGPKSMLDALLIAPCTGNTLAKLAAGVTDTAVTMATKSHLRNGRPVIIAVSTNDGLSASARNIGDLLNRKNYYFVPFRQDDFSAKPTSVVAELSLAGAAVAAALLGKQLQPLLLGA